MPAKEVIEREGKFVLWEDHWYPVLDDELPEDGWLMLLMNGDRPCEVCGQPSAVSPAPRCWPHRAVGATSFFEILARLRAVG